MSTISLSTIGIPIVAYVLGSIPFGLLFTRLFGSGDVRKSGSGNIGATNVRAWLGRARTAYAAVRYCEGRRARLDRRANHR